ALYCVYAFLQRHPKAPEGWRTPRPGGRATTPSVAKRPVLASLLDEAVANPSDGVEILRGRAKLFPEAPHVRVHGAAVDGGVIFPDGTQKLLAGKDPAPALGEESEEFEFCGGQFDGLVLDVDGVPGDVDEELAHADLFRGVCVVLEAAQHGFDAQHKFAGAEGFGHVIVGAQLEAEDAIDLGGRA